MQKYNIDIQIHIYVLYSNLYYGRGTFTKLPSLKNIFHCNLIFIYKYIISYIDDLHCEKNAF